MSKTYFIGANFKMNPRPKAPASKAYVSTASADVVVFPTFLELRDCQEEGLRTGAQCGHPIDAGTYTGDISMAMLAMQNVSFVLCGHSERRQHHEESDTAVAAQVHAAIRNGLVPVLCIGENADQYELKETENVLKRQLESVLQECGAKLGAENIVIAYEPVWAIGSGKTPDPAEADATHAFIRSLLPDPAIRIIYGGSVTPNNAAPFFRQKNIDGALVGGCSLKPEEFHAIVQATQTLS